jgi:hypothetical protein
MYVSSASRRVIIAPLITLLEGSLDDWDKEGVYARQLLPLARFIPDDLRQSFVQAITRTYVGYKGNSSSFSRTNFYSNAAATHIKEMFQSFDSSSTDCFVETVKQDAVLRRRIKEKGQLDRLRVLGNILLESEIASDEAEDFLEALCNEEKTEEFFTQVLSKIKKL